MKSTHTFGGKMRSPRTASKIIYKALKFKYIWGGGEGVDGPDPPRYFCTLLCKSHKSVSSVPMLCPGIFRILHASGNKGTLTFEVRIGEICWLSSSCAGFPVALLIVGIVLSLLSLLLLGSAITVVFTFTQCCRKKWAARRYEQLSWEPASGVAILSH